MQLMSYDGESGVWSFLHLRFAGCDVEGHVNSSLTG